MPLKDPVVIYDTMTRFEAQLICDDLKSAGIESLLVEVASQEGEVAGRLQVSVDRDDEPKARQFVETYQQAADADDDDIEEDETCPACGAIVVAVEANCPACGKAIPRAAEEPAIKPVDSPFAHPPEHHKGSDAIVFGAILCMVGLAVLGMVAAVIGLLFR